MDTYPGICVLVAVVVLNIVIVLVVVLSLSLTNAAVSLQLADMSVLTQTLQIIRISTLLPVQGFVTL